MADTTVIKMHPALHYQWMENISISSISADHSVMVRAQYVDDIQSDTEKQLVSYLPYLIIGFIWVKFAFAWMNAVSLEKTTKRHEPKFRSIPYLLPWVGNTLEFYLSKIMFASKVRSLGQDKVPVKLQFFNYRANVVSGFDHVNSVWRSKALDTKPAAMLSLTSLFAYPKAAYQHWAADDSGTSRSPHPNSNVNHADRMYFHTHRTTHAFMNGSTLKNFAKQFQNIMLQGLSLSRIETEWMVMPDLYSFVQRKLSTAAVEAICGPSLLALNPDFMADFWEFDGALPKFFGGFPRLTAPSAYKARTRCLESLKKWHKYAASNFDESQVDANGHDPFWGTSFMRSRQQIWADMKPMDADACASEDLGIIWGENSNSIPAAFWCLAHVVRDPQLLLRVRTECKQYFESSPSGPLFDADKLCRNPLMQSIWSEALRLYVALFIIRGSDHDDFQLDKNFAIKKQEMIVVDTYTAHHDSSIWSEGSSMGHYPLDTFWADRFLIYPNDPFSGPVKGTMKLIAADEAKSTGPRYTTAGLSGAWIPFGGGRHSCPGKQFAKQEIILCIAMMCTMFDIELDSGCKLQPDMDYFGMGTLPLKGRAPFRIRRRRYDD